MTLTDEVIVYTDPDGVQYLAAFGEDRVWYCWPAEAQGWQQRHGCSAARAEAARELEPRLATLALRLSGVGGEHGGQA
jgi:hypothetical protein